MILKIIEKKKEIFKTLIVIINSLIKFKEGGAAIFAEANKNHIIIMLGWVIDSLFCSNRFRDFVFK